MATPQPTEEKTSERGGFKGWINRRAQDHRGNLLLLIIGAGVFFCGVGIIFWADTYMPVSFKQELTGLAGMVLVAGGGITALIGHLSLSLFRLVRFFNDKPGD